MIRFGSGSYPGFHVDRMFDSDYIAVCSPKLLDADPPLRVPDDMRHQVLLSHFHINPTCCCFASPCYSTVFGFAPNVVSI